MTPLSKNLLRLMKQRTVRMADLARETGISPPVIYRLSNGITTNPNVDTLRPLAKFFGITIGQLVGDDPLPENSNPAARIPVLSWEHLTDIEQTPLQFLYPSDSVPPSAFALTVEDSAMEPQFTKGSLIIINPELSPDDHDFVVVQLSKHKKPVLKQILFDGDDASFRSLRADILAIKPKEKYRIFGVVVETRTAFN